MAKEEKKKPKNLDDFLAELQSQQTRDLDGAFKAHDEFTKEENINHYHENIFGKGQDELYSTFVKELDNGFTEAGGDIAKFKGVDEREKVKKALTKSLRKYFDAVHPVVSKTMNDLTLNESEQYDYLTSAYDEHIGVGRVKGAESIKEKVEGLMKGKRATIGHLKRAVSDYRIKAADNAIQVLVSKYTTHHFARYHPSEIAAYLKPRLEKEGFEVEDKLAFATADLGEHLGIRKAAIAKEIHPYLKRKEDKKK